MNRRLVNLTAAGATLASVLAALALRPAVATQPTTTTIAATAPLVAVAAPAATVAAPAAAATTTPAAAGTVTFPDGSSRPALNGVDQRIAMPWPRTRPFSPIAEVVHWQGTDWFHHQDGSYSTTIVRVDAVTRQPKQVGVCYTAGR